MLSERSIGPDGLSGALPLLRPAMHPPSIEVGAVRVLADLRSGRTKLRWHMPDAIWWLRGMSRAPDREAVAYALGLPS